MPYNSKAFGIVISRLRTEKGMSQESLSAFAGIARSHMNKVQEEYDEENKTITIIPPEFQYKVTIIDEKAMSLLPRDAEADTVHKVAGET